MQFPKYKTKTFDVTHGSWICRMTTDRQTGGEDTYPGLENACHDTIEHVEVDLSVEEEISAFGARQTRLRWDEVATFENLATLVFTEVWQKKQTFPDLEDTEVRYRKFRTLTYRGWDIFYEAVKADVFRHMEDHIPKLDKWAKRNKLRFLRWMERGCRALDAVSSDPVKLYNVTKLALDTTAAVLTHNIEKSIFDENRSVVEIKAYHRGTEVKAWEEGVEVLHYTQLHRQQQTWNRPKWRDNMVYTSKISTYYDPEDFMYNNLTEDTDNE